MAVYLSLVNIVDSYNTMKLVAYTLRIKLQRTASSHEYTIQYKFEPRLSSIMSDKKLTR